jgi:hypothetical protein
MAVELREEAGGKVLVVKLSGKLTREDYGRFVPEVERLIGQHAFERLALVGHSKWEAGMAVFCKLFTRATVRYFDETKAAKAFSWIKEGLLQPA